MNEGTVDLAGGQFGYIEEEDFPAAKEGVLLLINSFEPYIAWGHPLDLTSRLTHTYIAGIEHKSDPEDK